ncbi:hypothetical protein AURDEDRAFT_115281 [Auricularia subglabra TFB-10046 SS5]|nr:hypothetical protein AURDEDRAFT_115281 [Auricularia subglabra TFB-10046 SS5]
MGGTRGLYLPDHYCHSTHRARSEFNNGISWPQSSDVVWCNPYCAAINGNIAYDSCSFAGTPHTGTAASG